jgi:hypothetical protein
MLCRAKVSPAVFFLAGEFAKFGDFLVIPLANWAKLHGSFRQILSPNEIKEYPVSPNLSPKKIRPLL